MTMESLDTVPLAAPSSKVTQKRIVVAVIALAVVAAASAAYIYRDRLWSLLPGASAKDSFVLKIGNSYASDSYTISAGSEELSPVPKVMREDGVEVTPVDAIAGPDGIWYYTLVETVDPITANVYKRTKDSALVKLTHTPTMKFGLQVSANGELLFEEKSVATITELLNDTPWDIVYVDSAHETTKTLGIGERPTFISDSNALYRSDGSLYVASLSGGIGHAIASSSPVYAVNAADGTLGMLNLQTHKIDVYALTQDSTLSYKESIETPAGTMTLVMEGNTIIVGYKETEAVEGNRFVIENVNTGRKATFSIPALKVPNPTVQLIQAYE